MQSYANLVDLDNAENMRLFSLSEVSIQPRTGPLKFLKNIGVRFGVSGDIRNPCRHEVCSFRDKFEHDLERLTNDMLHQRDFGRFWQILADFGRFWQILADFGRIWQILNGPFSAVSTATIARIGAFFSFFRDLQD